MLVNNTYEDKPASECILVTGGAGFIGSVLTKTLLEMGHEVVVLDPLHSWNELSKSGWGLQIQERISLLKISQLWIGSTLDPQFLRKISECSFSRVIHLGMTSSAKAASDNPSMAELSIVSGTMNLLSHLDISALKNFVFVSSSMVYGDFTENPQTEKAATQPKNLYGKLKLDGEISTASFCKSKNIPYSIVRPISVYGPSDDGRRILNRIFWSGIITGKLELSNPKAKFDFTHIDDVVDGLIRITLSSPSSDAVFNLSSGRAQTLEAVVETIQKILPKLDVRFATNESDSSLRGAMDSTKAAKRFGFAPKVNFEASLPEIYQRLEKIKNDSAKL